MRTGSILLTALLGVSLSAQSPLRRHVILMIGDGMQLQHEVAASRYLHGTDAGLFFHALPFQAAVTTWNLDSYQLYAKKAGAPAYQPDRFTPTLGYDPTRGGRLPSPLAEGQRAYFQFEDGRWPATDSAAAASAMATGQKVETLHLSWLGPAKGGRALPTLAEKARGQRGMAIGVATTVPFNHATPAAFVTHQPSRTAYHLDEPSDEQGLAEQILLAAKPDVVLGGGHPGWGLPGKPALYLPPALLERVKGQKDLVVVERTPGQPGTPRLLTAARQAAQAHKRLFGAFGGADGGFEPHQPRHAPGKPQVDVGTPENPELKDLAVASLQVLAQNPKGFFLMLEQGDIDWANHTNNYRHMIGSVAELDEAVKAVCAYIDQPGDDLDWSNTLLIVTADHANSFMRLDPQHRLGKGELPPDLSPFVSYSTKGHTNELVRVYAKGPGEALDQLKALQGSWYRAPFAPVPEGALLLDNTMLHKVMAGFLGLNP